MRFLWGFLLIVAILFPLSSSYAAELPYKIILKTDFQIWEMYPRNMDLFSEYEKLYFKGIELSLLPYDQKFTDGQLETKTIEGLDSMKIRQYLESVIAPDIYREKDDVTIDMNEFGEVLFEGTGLYGRQLDIEAATRMLEYALNNGETYVNLPLIREYPEVTVLSEALRTMGITELFSAGETDFTYSPANRINNINVGLATFSGHIIKPGEEFVFGEVLGPVGPETGYKQELVIKGSETIPEYGGGLCQVSTTTFRAVLAAGFPITQRKNHSYAVSYYKPHGLDATVYPPSVDLKFINDSPAHILMHAFTIGNKAYYNFYGTKDERTVHLVGPYIHGWKSPPPKITKVSEKLAPGEVQVLGHAVPGLTISWYREVIHEDVHEDEPMSLVTEAHAEAPETPQSDLYHIYSKYQARPDYYAVGAE